MRVFHSVRAGRLSCEQPTRLARSERYLFVTHHNQRLVTAYDLTGDVLAAPSPAWSAKVSEPTGVTAILQDRVLMIVRPSEQSLLPVDIRAENPKDWRSGESFDFQSAGGRAVKPMSSAFGVVAIDATATSPARVFVGSRHGGPIVELTREGVLVRTFLQEDTRSQSLALGDGGGEGGSRLFVLSYDDSVSVVATGQVQVQVQAGQTLGHVKIPLQGPMTLLVIGDVLLIARHQARAVDFVPLSAP
jgi:hypothetical protein